MGLFTKLVGGVYSVTISKKDFEFVFMPAIVEENVDKSFEECGSFEEITIEDGVKKIGRNSFGGKNGKKFLRCNTV